MRLINKFLFLIITITTVNGQTFSQEYHQSLDIHLPYIPDLVIIDGKPTLYYELHLTNFASDSIDLKTLEISNAVDSTVLLSINKDELKKRYSRIGISQKDNKTILPAIDSAVIYIEFALQNDKQSIQLAHRIEFEILDDEEKKIYSVQSTITYLSKKPQIVLGPPLNNGAWAAVYEPSWERGHRRVIYTVNGKSRIPGRFAIDFIKLDDQGRYANGNDDLIKNWYGYGKDILAVADGVVASTQNDFPESQTLSEHSKYPADKATGNYISIDIGNKHFAFYEHLKPGSIKVTVGQRIKKGDVIASVGFTGQTTGPHLHFHIADANSPLGAEGIPFVFERFVLLGSYTNFENFGKLPWTQIKNSNQSMITNEHPVPNSVIKFSPLESFQKN